MSGKKKPTYANPKLEYVQSPDGPSVETLAEKWHKEDGDGYSAGHLKQRCHEEGWVAQRVAYQTALENRSCEAKLRATEQNAQAVVDGYTRNLAYVTGLLVRRITQLAEDDISLDKAIRALHATIELDRKVRGLDVMKIEHDIPEPWKDLFMTHGLRLPGNGRDRDEGNGECASEVRH